MGEDFSNLALHRIIKQNTNKQVGEAAARELSKELEDYAREISAEAIEIATARGRKTVFEVDVRDAIKEID